MNPQTMITYNNNPVLLFNSAPKLFFCDEKMPPVNKQLALVVVELDHGQPTSSPLDIEVDEGYLNEDGSWTTYNDWDEGQPWAIVAWTLLPDEATIRSHEIKWVNEPKSNNCAMMGVGR